MFSIPLVIYIVWACFITASVIAQLASEIRQLRAVIHGEGIALVENNRMIYTASAYMRNIAIVFFVLLLFITSENTVIAEGITMMEGMDMGVLCYGIALAVLTVFCLGLFVFTPSNSNDTQSAAFYLEIMKKNAFFMLLAFFIAFLLGA